ncbi:FkbM family methyltransferase [Thermodesulforhabdus norvegica]|uniref:Methyltransferase, FkbM family n=1 Tax=Thermodesulforhabdus norvegica TaxID=39841 RepID=A0A1I4TV41_9BACT|nr:FkbM family methyltransferase [Thermodesulforhabdus norvegica]SFM80559.1 methyltransferase, FkbM family [Thermodesulforhabdus norvegica]
MRNKADVLNRAGRILRSLGIRPSKLPGGRYFFRVLSALVGDLTIKVEGLYLTGSFWHRRELWKMQEGYYEKFTMQLFKKTLAPGMVVCDIGAHIGFYSLIAARKVGSRGRVYAFEPDPRTFPYLVRNIKQNGFSELIVPVKKAVSNQEGVLRLHLDEVTGGDTSLFHRDTSGRTIEVQSIKLDDFLPNQVKVDVIKMDIEGGETVALEGMENVLKRSSDVKMFVECNPDMLHKAGSSVEDLLLKLHSLGFEVKVINDELERLEMVESSEIYAMAKNAKGPTWSVNLYCSKIQGD